jgi:hypothetical protein
MLWLAALAWGNSSSNGIHASWTPRKALAFEVWI